VAVAVPFCLMALVVVADVLAGPQIGLLPLLSLGPALAPVSLGPARTVLTGGLAVVLSLLLAGYDGIGLTVHAVVAVATIAGATAAGVLASAARQRGERELVNVRAVADVAQRVLLRQVPRRVGQVRIAMRYISAAAAARIGGDLYDVVAVAGTARLIVADVQGKGLAAVQAAAVVLASFRESAYDAPDLAGIADHIELSLAHQAPDGKFVTAIAFTPAVPSAMAEPSAEYGDLARRSRATGPAPGVGGATSLVVRHTHGPRPPTAVSRVSLQRRSSQQKVSCQNGSWLMSSATQAATKAIHWWPRASRACADASRRNRASAPDSRS